MITKMPAAEYHRKELGVASNSALTRLAKSPAHYRAWLVEPESEPSEALLIGSAVHCAAFEPEVYAADWVTAPEPPAFAHKGTKVGKEERTEWAQDLLAWRAASEGKRFITREQRRLVTEMVASLRAHPIASQLLRGGGAELTLRWIDAATGVSCKARADYYRADLKTCIDLKTTNDASSAEFARSCARYRYHVQAAHYSEGFAALGSPLDAFVFVCVEKSFPYAVSVKTFGDDTIAFGRAKWSEGMRMLADCLAVNSWPGYPDEIEVIDLPVWAMKETR